MPTTLSKSKNYYGAEFSKLRDVVIASLQDIVRQQLAAETIAAITDNSAGTGTGATTAVPILNQFTHVDAASDLVALSVVNTGFGTIDNGLKVLGTYLNTEVLTPLGMTPVTLQATGTVATPGTVPAATKVYTGNAGATEIIQERTECNAAIVKMRNNFATLVRACNQIAHAVGAATLADNSLGEPDLDLVLIDRPTLADVVDNTGDGVEKAALDAAMASMANNIARLIVYIEDTLLDGTFLDTRAPVIVEA